MKPAADILATLDADGALDAMPFMPEMLQYVGRRFTVSRRVEKICDTIAATGSRRVRDTVYLEDLRCDGSGHGGCQAGCLIYWKEAWLRRVDGEGQARLSDPERKPELERRAQAGTNGAGAGRRVGNEVWRCQATEAFTATEPLKTSDLRQYWRELRGGNFGLYPASSVVLVRGFFMELASRARILIGPTPLQGDGHRTTRGRGSSTCSRAISCRSDPQEIASTLDEKASTGGSPSTARCCLTAAGPIASKIASSG